jgi:hypothetical protein
MQAPQIGIYKTGKKGQTSWEYLPNYGHPQFTAPGKTYYLYCIIEDGKNSNPLPSNQTDRRKMTKYLLTH